MKTTALILALTSTCAHAQFLDGNALLARLTGDQQSQAFALGYIAGAFDNATGVKICPPAGISVGQVRDMTRQALEALPAERHAPADIFVVAVGIRAWPCRPPAQPGRSL